MFKYRIINAAVQCGTKPPFNCINAPVRMVGETPQIKLETGWVDCFKDKPRPYLETYYGMPVAGIATSWELIPEKETRP
jgi:hypothetical protein